MTDWKKPTEINSEMRLTLEPSVISGEDVLTIEGLSKAFSQYTLFTDLHMEIKRGEHVALIGGNGTGKTTILKIIHKLVPKDAGTVILGSRVKIGYYDQEHQALNKDNTVFEEISNAYPDLTNTRIRNVLAAFLFTGEDVFKKISDLSGGEKGRVSLAKMMLSSANFLILDEPDKPSGYHIQRNSGGSHPKLHRNGPVCFSRPLFYQSDRNENFGIERQNADQLYWKL